MVRFSPKTPLGSSRPSSRSQRPDPRGRTRRRPGRRRRGGAGRRRRRPASPLPPVALGAGGGDADRPGRRAACRCPVSRPRRRCARRPWGRPRFTDSSCMAMGTLADAPSQSAPAIFRRRTPSRPYARRMIEARHLRVLRAVAATGSFSAAARELGCTQPAVSQQMKALEQSAGTPLLIRTGREMRLTQAGEALVRHAAGILAGLTAAEEEVAAHRRAAGGPGPAGVVPQRQLHAGADRARRDARRPPGDPGLAGGGRAAALGGDAARGRLRDRAGLPLRRGAVRLRRGVGRPGGAAAADRPAGRAGPGGAPAGRGGGAWASAELADEPWIAGCPRCRRHLVEVCEGAGFTPRIDFATDDYPAVVGLVGAGLGVAVLPELAVESVRAKGVRTVAVEPAVRAGGRGADPAGPGAGAGGGGDAGPSWSGRPRADSTPADGGRAHRTAGYG